MNAAKAVRFLLNVLCIGAMAWVLILKGMFLVFGVMALDGGPLPAYYSLTLCFFFAGSFAVILFWKWPAFAVAVSWLDLIALGILIFRAPKGLSLTPLEIDGVFFIAAHVGYFGSLITKRIESRTRLNSQQSMA